MNAHAHAAAESCAAASKKTTAARKDYLVFRLADREFGIALENVQELCNYDIVKPLASGPDFIAGTATRGGRRIPVVDLHALLAPGATGNSRLTDVVILHANGRTSGIAVDYVIDVVMLGAEEIGTCNTGDNGDSGIIGMASLPRRAILLLDAERLMTDFQPGPGERLAA